MFQLAKHRTLDGFAEHACLAALRQQHFGKTNGQCQLPRTLWSGQHDSMRQTLFIHHPHQALLHLSLSYNLLKSHFLRKIS